MTWWCVASKAPWDWSWRGYPGVWLLILAISVPYVVSVRRRARSGAGPVPGRTRAAFAGAVALLWVASDWPVGTLGAGYLASAHMLQYMIYSFGAAPLLLVGTPEWMARRILGRLRLYRITKFLGTPLRAGILFNVILLSTHSPIAVDNLRTTQIGSFAMDLVWLGAGLLLWLPIVSPLPELKPASYPVRMVYLFLAGGVLPMIPGGFLTFSSEPLYRLYELAPRIDGFSALSDQQLAGATMKIGNIPIVWPVIYALFHRWYTIERKPGFGGVATSTFGVGGDLGWVVTDDTMPSRPAATTRSTAIVPASPAPAPASAAAAAVASAASATSATAAESTGPAVGGPDGPSPVRPRVVPPVTPAVPPRLDPGPSLA